MTCHDLLKPTDDISSILKPGVALRRAEGGILREMRAINRSG